MSAEQNGYSERRQKTTPLVLLCVVCGWDEKRMRYTVQRCSRWHVGGSGWRRRESVCGQAWLMATEQQSPSQWCNNTSVLLAGWIQLFTSSKGGEVLCHGVRFTVGAEDTPTQAKVIVFQICPKRSYSNLSPSFFAHVSVWVDVCDKNKMGLDNSGLRAVNILQLIRLGFHQQVAAPGSQPEKCCQRQIYTHSSLGGLGNKTRKWQCQHKHAQTKQWWLELSMSTC